MRSIVRGRVVVKDWGELFRGKCSGGKTQWIIVLEGISWGECFGGSYPGEIVIEPKLLCNTVFSAIKIQI